MGDIGESMIENFTNYSTETTLKLATALCQISAQLLTRTIRQSLKKYLPFYRVNTTAKRMSIEQ